MEILIYQQLFQGNRVGNQAQKSLTPADSHPEEAVMILKFELLISMMTIKHSSLQGLNLL